MKIMRTGHDFDQLHLNCGGNVTDNCYLAPVDGRLLQVMPWPLYRHMTDHQLEAIWTYLSTIPCNAHNDTLGDTYPWLKNVCNWAAPRGPADFRGTWGSLNFDVSWTRRQ